MIDLALIGLIGSTALVSTLNAGTISCLTMILSSILGRGHSTKRLLFLGSSFIAGVLILNLAVGLIAYGVFATLPVSLMSYVALITGLILSIIGLVEVKDYFWYGRSISLKLPKSAEKTIHHYAIKVKNAPSFIILGIYTGFMLLPFFGAAYLAVAMILGINLRGEGIVPLVLYNLVLVLPMIILMLYAAFGTKISTLAKWKEEAKGAMRLTSGLLLIILAWILILIAGGVVNFG